MILRTSPSPPDDLPSSRPPRPCSPDIDPWRPHGRPAPLRLQIEVERRHALMTTAPDDLLLPSAPAAPGRLRTTGTLASRRQCSLPNDERHARYPPQERRKPGRAAPRRVPA